MDEQLMREWDDLRRENDERVAQWLELVEEHARRVAQWKAAIDVALEGDDG